MGSHVPAAQSEVTRHCWPDAQRALHVGPPQSTSVSSPFWILSSHAGTVHVAVSGSQIRLAQSLAALHDDSGGQRAMQVCPPQSTPLSS
jgi:hypothetical protein